MPGGCLLYYITDRKAFPGNELERRRRLLEKIAEAALSGIDYIQLREKDLSPRELESLSREAAGAIHDARKLAPAPRPLTPALLINSRTDIALAVGADGVHLRSDDVSPQEVRQMWESAAVFPTLRKARRVGQPETSPVIGVSCHSPAEVAQAAANGADFAIFAPVFEKKDAPGAQPSGLPQLEQACGANLPVLALGGVTLDNARSCLDAGSAGIAAIRLFQENDIAQVVRALRQFAS
jgi:thiamine-phosphate pyrophosphorylase